MKSILNIEVSCFANYRAVDKPKTVSLLTWLNSEKYMDQVGVIRCTDNKAERDKIKATLPAITPSGIFSKREVSGLIEHSGFMQIDIDGVDPAEIKKILSGIVNVAYCGLSVSALGVWGLIPIAYPEHHKEYFLLIEKALAGMDIKIDPACKDISRLRGYSCDPDAYFNHNAIVLDKYYIEPPKPRKRAKKWYGNDNDTPVWEQYNQSNFFEAVLFSHGWSIDSKRGEETYYTRPGKNSGISAGFSNSRRVFYVFTSSTEFQPNKGYVPFAIYAILEHGGDFKKAAKELVPVEIKTKAPALPQWCINIQGALAKYEAGQINEDAFLDSHEKACKQSGLSEKEYVKYVNNLN